MNVRKFRLLFWSVYKWSVLWGALCCEESCSSRSRFCHPSRRAQESRGAFPKCILGVQRLAGDEWLGEGTLIITWFIIIALLTSLLIYIFYLPGTLLKNPTALSFSGALESTFPLLAKPPQSSANVRGPSKLLFFSSHSSFRSPLLPSWHLNPFVKKNHNNKKQEVNPSQAA